MKNKQFRYFVGDFETTVYKDQEYTEVWASAVVEFGSEDVKIFHSIEDTFNYFVALNENICVYYHNLKFDGEFWISYLFETLEYKQATEQIGNGVYDLDFVKDEKMPNKSVKYCISDLGQWYNIKIKINKHIIELRDSLKLIPMSVKAMGKAFNTNHRKLEMEYTGFRYAGCTISDEEKAYIANDVLVVKESLEQMFAEGHKKLTIASCALSEFRTLTGFNEYVKMFPNMYKTAIDPEIYKYSNAGDYIHKSYKGGWCYVVRGKENKVLQNGVTADVNSLYPSMMSSESGNYYPIGFPNFWWGNYIPDEALIKNRYYFVRVKTRFYIKPNKLPTIQIKGDWRYKGTEWLETSDVYSKKDNSYHKYYVDIEGKTVKARPTLTLTMTDYKLMKEHYYLEDFEILDGCWFETKIGIFDAYIEKYKKMKLESTGGKRSIAKLLQNSLYGKMAASTNSSFKLAYNKGDYITFLTVTQNNKKPGYIPIGAAITSYARNFTIRAAQQNFYGADKRGFCYADTDSIHCDLEYKDIKGITVHDKNYCCWKLEATWDIGFFSRQKTYIEHVIAENLEPIERPYYNIKCAGMPEQCKNLFQWSMDGLTEEEWKEEHPEIWNKMNDVEKAFVLIKRDIKDFQKGLLVPSKLLPKRIKGGIVLQETTYEMR